MAIVRSIGFGRVLFQGKCHFLPGGGLLKIGGSGIFLRSKGDQKIFLNKKVGITYIF